jgi:hypothetical protein
MPYMGKQLQEAVGPDGTQQPLDLHIPTYSVETAHKAVAGYGEAGRALYAQIQGTADVAYPIVYSIAFALLLSFLWKRAAPAAKWTYWLPLLPIVGALFDLTENFFIVQLLKQYPQQPDSIAQIARAATFCKWLFVLPAMLLTVAGLVGWLLKRR